MAEPEKKTEEHAHHAHHHSHHDQHHVRESHSPTVLITGANSGIGLATAVAFAAAGWNTYASVRDLSKADALVETSKSAAVSRRIHVLTMDVTDPQSVDDGIKYVYGREGRIDALVNNAGIGIGGPLEGTSDQDVQRIFATNVFSVISASRSVLPYMRARGKGTIINVSSCLSIWTWPMTALYCSTKFAVDGFTSSLAKEVESFGVRVVTVNPPLTQSKFGDNMKPGTRLFPVEIYDHVQNKHMGALSPQFAFALSADAVAKCILEAAVDEDKSRLHYYPDAKTEERAGQVLKEPTKQTPSFY